MRWVGFSTGALAKGDFRRGLDLQHASCQAVELSALRETELDALVAALPDLELTRFKYVSLHAPSQLDAMTEEVLLPKLAQARPFVHGIVVHPDTIHDFRLWRDLGESLILENMDQRKPCARNVSELRPYFEELPAARFCLDLGHARQVDPTLSVAVELLHAYGDRLAELHISEVDTSSKHVAISSTACTAYRRLATLLPEHVPAIIESVIPPTGLLDEIAVARRALGA